MIEFIETIHWGAVFTIIIIDILLGGDNAVVIGMACRNLDKSRRMQGIVWGTVGAIVMRIVLIIFAMKLLSIPFLKGVGALLLLWIGVKLLIPEEGHHDVKSSTSIWGAVKTILIADVVMSLDNVIAIAGVAQNTDPAHQIFYVVFGLLVSVPIIIWGSTLVLKLIDRFPFFVVAGAGLLGWIAGGMFITDPMLDKLLFGGAAPSNYVKIIAEVVGVIIVVGLGLLLARSMKKKDSCQSHVTSSRSECS